MPDTDMNQLIAKNVRTQMVKRDLSLSHLAFKLKLKDDQVKARLSGKIPFSDDELEMLAPYMDTTFEALHMDLDVPTNGKGVQNGKPPEAKEPEKTTLSRQRSVAASLITTLDTSENLLRLVDKMFIATLAGKLDDLAYYIRNNILIKAVKEYGSPVSEEDKVVFVDHCLDQYETWRAGMLSDMDDVMQVALDSNTFEAVSSAVMPSEKGRLSQFMNGLIKANTEEGLVDVEKLVSDIKKAVSHLQRVNELLGDYLGNHEQ
jgi:hypothetical protein